MNQLRWGLLSTASIARKNWRGLALAENARLVAVASRETAKAQKFIDECSAQTPMDEPVVAIGSYSDLLARDDIDAVYIPLPTGLRKEWIIKALQAGKHVLSEKPVAMTMPDMKHIADEAKKAGVQFMDGVMFAHSNRYEKLLEFVLAENGIGTVRRISSSFTFLGGKEFQAANIRGYHDLEPLGCLGDLGWYCVRMSLGVKNWQTPSAVIGRTLHAYGRDTDDRVPSEFSGDLFFPDGTTANIFCSFLIEIQQWAHISGDKGNVFLDDFVLPFAGDSNLFKSSAATFDVNGCDASMQSNAQDHVTEEAAAGKPTAQETNMFRNFSNDVLRKNIQSRWLDQTIATQRVISALKQSSDAGSKLIEL